MKRHLNFLNNHNGFTLMEVTLFMAISSALAVVAFVGLGPKLRNVRFTDSMRGLEVSIKSAFNNSQKGYSSSTQKCEKVNENGGPRAVISDTALSAQISTGTSQDCVRAGVVAIFYKDSVEYYNLALLRNKIDSCKSKNSFQSIIEVAGCFGFTPIIPGDRDTPKPSSTYKLTNGLILSDIDNKNVDHISIGYARNPEDNQEFIFFDGMHESNTKKLCYALSGRKASINFSIKSVYPKVEFNDEKC